MKFLKTKNGYDFYEVASAVQKAIRRNNPRVAGYFALELHASNFTNYLWKRLLTISAEDCYSSTITTEIYNLYKSWEVINKTDQEKTKGRIFISKAILILCRELKSRDADHLSILVYDKRNVDTNELEDILKDKSEKIDLPEYVFDCHTLKGKRMGKNKEQFIQDEFKCLNPFQKGLFDNLV